MKYLKYFENINDLNYSRQNLTTLKGLDIHNETVGGFDCSYNDLTSLEFGPEYVYGDYKCQYNELTSLQYCPIEIYGDFNCGGNQIRTLDHLPHSIRGSFDCSTNMITEFILDLTEELGEINGDFNCSSNKLTSLYRCPSTIHGYFDCSDNDLEDLDDYPNDVGGGFYCRNNKWKKPIPIKTIKKFDIDIEDLYTDNQKEKFSSYDFQYEYLTKNALNYINLYFFGISDKIKEDFDWLFDTIDNNWDKHISTDILNKYNILPQNLYPPEIIEKFGSYNYQKPFLTQFPEKYKDLEFFGFSDEIKEEFDWLFNAIDMGLM